MGEMEKLNYKQHELVDDKCLGMCSKEMNIMNIVIFGAAGATGRIVVERALDQGHEVTAFDRNTAPLTIQHPKLTLVQGDIFNPSQVEAAIAGQDAVISVLGVRPGVTIPVCSEGTK